MISGAPPAEGAPPTEGATPAEGAPPAAPTEGAAAPAEGKPSSILNKNKSGLTIILSASSHFAIMVFGIPINYYYNLAPYIDVNVNIYAK